MKRYLARKTIDLWAHVYADTEEEADKKARALEDADWEHSDTCTEVEEDPPSEVFATVPPWSSLKEY